MVQIKLKPKHVLAWILTLCMVFGMLPMTAFAEGGITNINELNAAIVAFNSGTDDVTVTITGSFDTANTEITAINNASGNKLTIKSSSSSDIKTITRGKAGNLFTVTKGELILENITIDGGSTGAAYGGSKDGGGSIVDIQYLSTLTMNDGTTLQNNITNNRCGVYVSGGTFNMTGGTITNFVTTNNGATGAGVFVNGKFNMSGSSSITNCTSGSVGGGVYIDDINPTNMFSMNDTASITNCTAKNGGGAVYNGNIFNISGSPTITGDKTGTGGVYLRSGKTITKTGALTGGNIDIEGIGGTPAANTVVVTGTTPAVESDLAKFHISNAEGSIGECSGFVLSGNDIVLGSGGSSKTVTYKANDGGTVSGMPSDKAKYDSGKTVTVKGTPVSTSKFFDGWNTKADGTGKSYTAEKTFKITENITLYAQWKDIVTTDSKLKYKVTGKNEVACIGTTDNKATSISIPNTIVYKGITYKITSITKNAFRGNEKITTVKIGNNVKTINNTAFYKCPNLKNATIGTGLVTLGNDVFCHAKAGLVVTINSTKLMTVKTAINHGTKNVIINVPKSKLSAYKKLFAETSKTIKVESK